MATLTFKYRSGVTVYSRTFSILNVKGLTDPDAVEIVGIQEELRNGSISEKIQGFRRLVSVDLGVLNEAADQEYVLNWLKSPLRWTTDSLYASTNYALADPEGFANDWRGGSQYSRYYNIPLRENVIHTEWPTATEPVETETLYISGWIQITGTEASPQTLTTNAGVLATMADGNVYPAINLAAYTVTVLITERQSTLVHQIGAVTQSGTDISFTVAASGAGNPYSDGNVYAKFTIGLQAI